MSERGTRQAWERLVGVAPGRMARPEDVRWLREVPRDGPFRPAWTPALFRLAYDLAAPGAALGVDGRRAVEVLGGEVEALWEATWVGSWRPSPLRRATIPAHGRKREIGVPTVADQVVMAAWRLLAEPRLERRLANHVWGFRPGRGCQGAIRQLTAPRWTGPATLVRTDIRRMFESLNHRYLHATAERIWGGGPPRPGWIERLGGWLRGVELEPEDPGTGLVRLWLEVWSPRKGVATGVSVSPALANAYLGREVDAELVRMRNEGLAIVVRRYADDIAVLSRGDGREVLARLNAAVVAVRLRLHPTKTVLHHAGIAADWPARVLGTDLVVEDTADGQRLRALPRGVARPLRAAGIGHGVSGGSTNNAECT